MRFFGRRCWGMTLLSRRCPESWWRSRGRTWQAWNEVLRIAWNPNPVWNEMWFLTVDPLIRISVFIAKLSKRQYCWRVFEDFQCQEFIQFFDIHRCFFMRLHFSIGGYDYRKTTQVRQKYPKSASLKSFLLIMCMDAPEWTTNSRSSSLRLDASKHQFSEGEKNVALSCSFCLGTFLASFHAASKAPCSCHSVSSRERSSNFGALGPRSWGSPAQIFPSEGFWPRMCAWRATASVNFTRWIGLCMSELFRKIGFGGFMSWKTQPNCRVSDNWRFDEFRPNFWSLLLSGLPDRSWYRSVTDSRSCQSPFFNKATALLSLFDLDHFVGCSLTWRCANEHFSPNRQQLFFFVEQAFWRMPPFTEWVIASSFEVILARPSRHSTGGGFTSGTSGPRWFSLTLLHERILRRIWWWTFSTLIDIVAETAIVSFHTLPVGFPLRTISKNSLYKLFCFPDSWPRRSSQNFHFWPQNSYFEFPARYFFSP